MNTRALASAFVLLVAACDNGSSKTTIHETGSWACPDESCQDVFDLDVPAGTHLTVGVSDVTGLSDSSPAWALALYAPGVDLGGTNLLTGTTAEFLTCLGGCDAQMADGSTSVTVAEAGTYRLAVIFDWDLSCGAAGSYAVTITGDKHVALESQTVDDGTTSIDNACP